MKSTVKKLLFIILILTTTILLCGCQNADSGKTPSSTKADSSVASGTDASADASSANASSVNASSKAASSANSVIHEYVDPVRTYGNLLGNINNRGLASKQGEWTYFASSTGIYKIKDDNSNLTRLCDARGAYHVNVSGGWVYFLNNCNIYKVRTNGLDYQKFSDAKAYSLTVVDGWMYYTPDGSFSAPIIRTPIDKYQPQTVVEESVMDRCITKEKIYFKYDGSLYSVNPDGSNRVNYGSGLYTQHMMFYNGYKYTTGTLTKSYVDDTNLVKFIQSGAFNVTIENDWIYYTLDEEGQQNHNLYKMKIDGSNNQKLSNAFCDDVNVVGDWIYYHKSVREITIGSSTQRTYNLYKMKIDGTEDQKVI